MNRYAACKFDGNTYVVVDRLDGGRELAVCSWYELGGKDFRKRAYSLARLLNQQERLNKTNNLRALNK